MFRLKKNFSLRAPPMVKGKNFDTRFGLIHVQTGKKFFWGNTPPHSKRKKFWHIHVQTGKKMFLSGDSKGKNFFTPDLAWYIFRWKKKNFCRGTHPPREKILTPDLAWYMFRLERKIFVKGHPPHPTGKGKIFLHQIWLDTCSDWKKIFGWGTPPPQNSKDLLWVLISCWWYHFASQISVGSQWDNKAYRYVLVYQNFPQLEFTQSLNR